MLRNTELMRRENDRFCYVIFQINEFLVDYFPSISVVMALEIRDIFKDDVAWTVILGNSTDVVEEVST